MEPVPTWARDYRYLTAEVRPISFCYRDRPEDFFVEELPQYAAAGEGTHLYVTIEKRNLATMDAVRLLARALGREEREFGFAGRKDTKAVARQRISIEHEEEGRVRELDLPGVEILDVDRHTNKLRVGHLAGNRFRLVLRSLPAAELPRVEAVLSRLESEGLPNYYGKQRFGRHGTTWMLGRLLVRGEHEAYVKALLSEEHADHSPARAEFEDVFLHGTRSARKRLGDFAPRLSSDLAPLARQIARRPTNMSSAARAVPLRTRLFHVSALQARVFNHVLSARMAAGTVALPQVGDVVTRHGPGGTRRVEEADHDEALRAAAAFELSPTGPIPGHKILATAGQPAAVEQAALQAESLALTDFASVDRGLDLRGSRRPLRVPLKELTLERDGDLTLLGFELPSGSYATSVLEELRKTYYTPNPPE
jgi:tRNA pseudouridine13 synthase